MKYLIVFVSFLFSGHVRAFSECLGRTRDGSWVRVQINTSGATGIPDQGEVLIEKQENKFGYRFTQEDITQFFEYDEPANNTAMIGLAAYVNKESPVAIKYNGSNFVDKDLKLIIEENLASAANGNFLRVWKGPGHAAKDQFQLTTVACSTWRG